MTIAVRYKITLEYLGATYCGWQRQKDALSLQQTLEEAIFKFTKEIVRLHVAGRTDSGVNAYGQVAHFDLKKHHDPSRLMHSVNHFLRPHTIGIIKSEIVDQDFHARFSAEARHYVYKILNRPSVNIIDQNLRYWIRYPLNVDEMRKGADFLLGLHDFTSFRASICQSNSPIKTINKIQIIKSQDNIDVHISAKSFLHHMVRNIVGSLILVGNGKWSAQKIKEALESRDRKTAGPTAPASGLYFLKVDYPS